MRVYTRMPKWAHKVAQRCLKEIDGWFSGIYIIVYLHKFLFYLCKWYIFCAILNICARFVQHRARFVQKGRFLCAIEIPVFIGIPEDLCTLVQCCAPSESRAHAKESTRILQMSPRRFTAARTPAENYYYILNYANIKITLLLYMLELYRFPLLPRCGQPPLLRSAPVEAHSGFSAFRNQNTGSDRIYISLLIV